MKPRIVRPPCGNRGRLNSASWPPPRRLVAAVLAVGLLAAAGGRVQGESVVRELWNEFHTVADVDGDGQADAVIVDRPGGNYRIGYQQAGGGFVWAGVRGSGLAQEISGFAVGQVLAAGRDALLFTAPSANRVLVVDAGSRTQAGQPQPLYPGGIGPTAIAALDLPALGPSPLADVFVGTVLNADPYRVGTVRVTAGGFASAADVAGPGPLRLANALAFRTGGAGFVVALESTATNRSLLALNFAGPAPGLEFAERGLAPDTEYVTARFRGTPLAEFLLWQPGRSNVVHRPVIEPSPGTFRLGAATDFDLGVPVGALVALPGPTGTRLWVSSPAADAVRIFTFNGVGAPVLQETFTAPAGESFSGALPLPNGSFVGLATDGNATFTTSARLWTLAGGKFTPGPALALPSLEQSAATGNVLFFAGDPRVDETAVYLGAANARDWTSQPVAGPPTSVQAETFRGSQSGLGNPAALNVGNPPAGTTSIVPSQLADAVSLFALTAPSTSAGASVSIVPAGGSFAGAVEVSLAASRAGHEVFYRLNRTNAWTRHVAPLRISTSATLSAYSQPPGGPMSAIRSAQFTITTYQPDLDSDADQVPDSVELARGLDPLLSGPDADGDGYSDLEELVNGSNPADAANKPAAGGIRLGPLGSYNVQVQPLPVDPVSGIATPAAVGTRLEAHSLEGGLLAAGPIPGINPVPAQVGRAGWDRHAANPLNSAVLGPIPYSTREELIAVSTPVQYEVNTSQSDLAVGRELLALAQQASLREPDLPRAALYTNANSWILVASNVVHRFVQLGQQTEQQTASPITTLTALLFERRVSELLAARGELWASNLTLFPFRPADAGRAIVSTEMLWSLRQQTDAEHPGHDLREVLRGLRSYVEARTNAGAVLLRDVANGVYLVNARSNNVAPGQFLPPVSALREFVLSGVLASNYVAASGISAERLVLAPAVISELMRLGAPRQLVELRAVLLGDDRGYPLVEDLDSRRYLLANGVGDPFPLLDTFDLTQATELTLTGYRGAPVNLASEGGGDGFEVVSAVVSSVTLPSPEDENGNLLPDAWELRFLGGLDRTAPFEDPDGDGYRTLQELFAGTDPMNAASAPAAAPIRLEVPTMSARVAAANPDFVEFTWMWPAAFADRIVFGLRGGGDLGVEFADIATAVSREGDVWRVTVPREDVPRRFFRLALQLK